MRSCYSLNKSVAMYEQCDACASVAADSWSRHEAPTCTRMGQEPKLLQPRTSPRRARHPPQAQGPALIPGDETPARGGDDGVGYLRDQRQSKSHPRRTPQDSRRAGAKSAPKVLVRRRSARGAPALAPTPATIGTRAAQRIALSTLSARGPTPHVTGGRGGITDIDGATNPNLRRLGADLAPALVGVACAYYLHVGACDTQGETAVLHATANVQEKRAAAAQAEDDPAKKRRLQELVSADIALAVRTAVVQKKALGAKLPAGRAAQLARAQAGEAARTRAAAADGDARQDGATALNSDPVLVGHFGLAQFEAMRNMGPKQRRPLVAAACRKTTRAQFQAELGQHVSHDEWCNARRHFLHPGPFVVAPRMVAPRQGVSDERLMHLMGHLGAAGRLQRYAFGEKIFRAVGG